MEHIKLGIMPVAMVMVTTIVSAIGMQIMAEYGLQAVFYYVIASLMFFIPTAVASVVLVRINTDMGLYGWINKTLGTQAAFMAVWLQWSSTVIFYPTVLAFLASIVGYLFDPNLVNNSYYMFVCMLLFGWLSVLGNLFGTKVSVRLSNVGAIFAAILPALLVFILALCWILRGQATAINWHTATFFPAHFDLSVLALLASFVAAFAGIEYSSYFIKHMHNPQKNYVRAVAIASVLIIILNILGTLGISLLVKQQSLNLMTGFMQAFSSFFMAENKAGLIWLTGSLMCIGFLCAVSTMMLAVALGLLVLTQNRLLPQDWGKLNRHGVPARIVVGQGIFMTLLAMLYLFLPQVKQAYWITGVVASLLLGLKYIIMFVAAIRVCITRRIFVYSTCAVGIATCVMVIILAFVPPQQIGVADTSKFFIPLIGLTAGVLLFPLLVFYWRSSAIKSLVEPYVDEQRLS